MNLRIRIRALLGCGGLAAMVAPIPATAALGTDAALVLEAKVPLGDVRGRIDHLGVDLARQRLFGAELGNDNVRRFAPSRDCTSRRVLGTSGPLTRCMSPTPATDRFVSSKAPI